MGSESTDHRARAGSILLARVALATLALGIVLGLDWAGEGFSEAARLGFYLTISAGFVSILASAAWLRAVGPSAGFVLAQIGFDVAMVTALVYFAGDPESFFTFLYLTVVIYAAMLWERPGALAAAGFSTLGYGALLVVSHLGLVASHGTNYAQLPLSVLAAAWSVRVGAFSLVAVLASFLSAELRRAGRALDKKTSDLGELRELYEQTVVSIMSGLLTTDEAGRITSFNPEAERITGRKRASVLGRALEEIIPGTKSILANSGVPRDSKRVSRARLEYENEFGEALFLGVAASILRGDDGTSRGHVVIFQNVTSVAAMERELRSAERLAAVGEMAAKIAHEIRNPLASISGSIQILKASGGDGKPAEPDSDRLMEIVLRETERLNTLIGQFLQYSRPVPPTLEPVPIRALLEEMRELLEASKPDEVELHCDGPEGLSALADRDQIKQVLWNLAINGLQAMPKGGRLTLSVKPAPGDLAQAWHSEGRKGEWSDKSRQRPDGGGVEIAISDSGDGILPEDQGRIFEPFFTTKAEGTGLGLATVHRVVEGHGGSIRVDSQEGGTTFRLYLPRAGDGE